MTEPRTRTDDSRRLLQEHLRESGLPEDVDADSLVEQMAPWLSRLLDEARVQGRVEGAAVQASAVDAAMSAESEAVSMGDGGYVTRVDPDSIFESMLEDGASIEAHRERWRAEGRSDVIADIQGITDTRVADRGDHGAQRSPVRQRTDEFARLLIETYEKAENVKVGVSFIATFADMGRAVVDHIDTRLNGYDIQHGVARAITVRRFDTSSAPDSLGQRTSQSYLSQTGDNGESEAASRAEEGLEA